MLVNIVEIYLGYREYPSHRQYPSHRDPAFCRIAQPASAPTGCFSFANTERLRWIPPASTRGLGGLRCSDADEDMLGSCHPNEAGAVLAHNVLATRPAFDSAHSRGSVPDSDL